jgi:hypothetical protein
MRLKGRSFGLKVRPSSIRFGDFLLKKSIKVVKGKVWPNKPKWRIVRFGNL